MERHLETWNLLYYSVHIVTAVIATASRSAGKLISSGAISFVIFLFNRLCMKDSSGFNSWKLEWKCWMIERKTILPLDIPSLRKVTVHRIIPSLWQNWDQFPHKPWPNMKVCIENPKLAELDIGSGAPMPKARKVQLHHMFFPRKKCPINESQRGEHNNKLCISFF